MCRKLFYLFCFILLISLTASSVVEGFDPTLVGWWKLDETSGTIAADSSGYGNNGTIYGNPQWVMGNIGGALQFDGNGNYVDCGTSTVLQVRDQITLACWIKAPAIAASWATIISKGDDSYRLSRPQAGAAVHMGINGTVTSPYQWFDGTKTIADNNWHHVAGVYDGDQAAIYIDGAFDVAQAATGQINASTAPLYIGDNSQATGRYWTGLIDDVRIYSRALTPAEIYTVMLGKTEGFAYGPNLKNGATDIPHDVTLSWSPGTFVNTHNVYFGTDFNNVNEASVTDPRGILFIQDRELNTYNPGLLEFSQTYYWRVDEVNAPPDTAIYKGDVWSFEVEPFAYPITSDSIIATASSFSTNSGPGKTTDGSGLNNNDQHSTTSSHMWLSSISGSQPTWIQYEFDRLYKLYEMWVWNSNQSLESAMGVGIKSAKIEYSIDGSNWEQLGDAHEFNQATGKADYTYNTTIDFGGAAARFVKITANSNWKGILRQYGLSEVRLFYIPVAAWEPSPASGQTGVSLDAALSWRAGRDAAVHQVYFSSDRSAVESDTALVGTVNKTSFPLSPLGLELGKTYYWKVNEVNEADIDTSWEGDIWSFVATEYLTVEDFERYDDFCNRIFYAWLDGYGHSGDTSCGVAPYDGNKTGSTVGKYNAPFAERTVVHEGRQSMPLAYNNADPPYYSETEHRWTIAQDWTRGGAQRLTLWFYGDIGNAAQPLYVVLQDSTGAIRIVTHNNPEAIQVNNWQEWTIPLSSVSGLNLSSIKSMYIGVGNRTTPSIDSMGRIYIDDIRLYP